MKQFDTVFEDVKKDKNYEEKARIMQYVGNVLRNAKNTPEAQTREIREFAVSEMRELLTEIPKTQTYKEKDKMFFYTNSLLMVFTHAGKDLETVSEEQMETVRKIANLVNDECVVENAVDELFKRDNVQKSDLEKVIGLLKPLKDEYQRGIFYQKLNDFKEEIRKFSPEAKGLLTEYVVEDVTRLLADEDHLDEDKITALEYAVDVCKHFIDERLLGLLEKIMLLKFNRIRYYAMETLLENGKAVSAETVRELAEDLTYAELTFTVLHNYGKESLFPKKFATPEYLAKSDMVHWLNYPTELNREPDEIELLGAIRVKRELYHVFKFKSNSENLSEDLQNEYLIGWSGDCGGTFSNFDKLSDYEKKTPQKTLKYIAKKLLK